ncbi:hypothetical protein BDFG_09154 [Blastomyces dermatitidis ATCC 26199]|nr:hypothetical protein BDFG_09154 [Blastomyces dermatitidis ATCC 26199]
MHKAPQKEREGHGGMQEAEHSVRTAHSHDAGVGVAGTGVAGAGEPDTGASVGDWGAAEEGTEGGAAEEEAAEGAGGDAGDPATHGTGNSSIITSSKFLINDSTSGSLSSVDVDLSTHEDSTQIKTNISASASTQNCARKYDQKPAEKETVKDVQEGGEDRKS